MTAGYLPRGGGATGELVRALDWSGTALGAIADWPASLRTSVDIVLNSPIAMVLMWGPRHVMVYNDDYAAIAGAKHPAALGGSVPEVWPEIWDWNRAVLEAGLRGEARAHRENPMVLLRHGAPEQVWFDLFYTPVRDESGAVAGVLCTVVEITGRLRQERSLRRASEELGVVNRTLAAEGRAAREANVRLDEERGLLRALFEQAPGFMAVLRGPRHVFELANRPYQRLTGHRALIGRPLAEALPEVRAQGFIELLDAAYRSGQPYQGRQVEVELLPPDGGPARTRYVDFVYQPIKDGAGAVSGILVEGVDVTETRENEERWRIAQQAGGVGSFEWFPDTGEVLVSASFRRIWGLADERPVDAAALAALVEPQDRDKIGPARMQLGLEGNPLAYVEYRIRRPDNGQLRWIARQGEVVAGAGPRRYVGVSFDVTGRKLTEEALHASQDRLAAIFGQASVGLAELDLDGNFRRVNGALCAMLGRGAEQLLASNMDDIMHPDDVAGNAALRRRLVDTGAPFTLEKRYLKPDGAQVWVASNFARLVDESGRAQALIAVQTDITERRRAEQALHELNETLEQRVAREVAERAKAEEALLQAQKMEAVGQLTGGIAHDFNNVLQIISGNLHLLYQQAPQDSATRQRLETAIAAVERGAKLSSHLLAFARRQPLQPVVADLGRLLRDMDALLRRALGEAVEISSVVGGGLWNTLVDPSQLENVILNLAINARDAMDGAGRLDIELGNAVIDGRYARKLAGVQPGQYVLLSVRDSGCGMSGDVLQRAFEPFFTTKAEGVGTGLGLSMAYGFVTQSHGHIRIESEPGRGTVVKIYLPRCLQEAQRHHEGFGDEVAGGSETILVVEDDVGVRATVVDMLGELGYTVLKAEDGESALATLHGGAQVDLLFTDVIMPGPVRSPDLARRAQELLPDIAVLFTSGYPQDAIVHGGRLDAGVELLSKPYRRDELARKLRQVLAGRRQQNQERARQSIPGGTSLNLTNNALAAQPGAAPTSLKILVVEDNLDSQQMVCELVGMLGHTVSGVSDGERAWELVREHDFDILFSDVSLPGMSGIELARLVLRDKPGIRVIFSTGYGKETLEGIGFEARILRKPYDLMELKAALEYAGAE
ncbi:MULTISPECIES: hybrid sensor histidine kinase/response regulator [unclassified Janthinobacterium]|uniref:hybrid sensor histidine kinase/response regulator n=1 Tax=unclassified Janthinobacterium TaxID=2610881 RepID=UPI00034531AD|nr:MULTISPECIES: PAS domain S-box protein [unclassified Janthinobacterium]MEC5161436.1 PAS domain S-box-containing protein [Janthinobacterium sp. CG_S6]